jgi:uncharacterized protein (DUF1330 family)
MAKGYWLPQIDVSNMDGYKAYMAATPPAHEKYKGVALVRGGRSEVVEGSARSRCVIREFPDYATALACYRSDEYQRARPLRLPHSQCNFVIVEGYDGVQPPRTELPPTATAKKGYWIGHIDVTEPEGYKAYMAVDMAPFGKFGGRFHRGAGISGLRRGARLLSLERLSGGKKAARRQGRSRSRHRRGL